MTQLEPLAIASVCAVRGISQCAESGLLTAVWGTSADSWCVGATTSSALTTRITSCEQYSASFGGQQARLQVADCGQRQVGTGAMRSAVSRATPKPAVLFLLARQHVDPVHTHQCYGLLCGTRSIHAATLCPSAGRLQVSTQSARRSETCKTSSPQ